MVAGCGGEKEVPAANVAQPQASAPIVVQNETENQAAGNVSEPVSREGAARPAPAPAPERPDGDRYRAIGTEPFWAVTVKGSTATLDRPDKAPVRYAVSRHDDKWAIRYLGDGFSMTITEGPCSDGMSDAVWSDRVALAFGEGTLNGCGGLRDDQGTP
ncbi:membrane-like protein [Sphingobium sp. JS3065]|uniref:membrane-like protein n=1 Tax=Sphingobium sp. JS3065 TaxID=2970925 RepID=UPI0022640439|nr:membrane-like protein [Sphingobium sp. JS3065]UZW56913.1 membrane-like protein [Sphingobium sp. JS3065]